MNRILGGLLLIGAALVWASTDSSSVAPQPPAPVVVNRDVLIEGTGLRVLLLEETSQRSKLPPEQLAILNSVLVAQWLQDNKADYRIADVDVEFSGESEQKWATARSKWLKSLGDKPPTLPWLLISNDTSDYSGTPGKNPTEMISILDRFK